MLSFVISNPLSLTAKPAVAHAVSNLNKKVVCSLEPPYSFANRETSLFL